MSQVRFSLRSPSLAAHPSQNPCGSPPFSHPQHKQTSHRELFKMGPFSSLFCPIKILHSQVERGEIRIHIDLHVYSYIYIPLYR